MKTTTKHTTDHLQQLNERLAVIDSAQKNITDLATHGDVAAKRFRQQAVARRLRPGPLEAIVADVLPKGAYEFQYTLSNKSRPDCAIFMPDSRPLIIDAKFPLEAMTALRDAKTDDERQARRQLRARIIGKHIADIAEKYLIPGETQDIALMFIPSESIFADLHERFDDVVQKALPRRRHDRVAALLMLAIQVVQQIQKDARMREAADQILQRGRPHDRRMSSVLERPRAQSRQGTSATSTRTSSDILTSAGKIEKRAAQDRGASNSTATSRRAPTDHPGADRASSRPGEIAQ